MTKAEAFQMTNATVDVPQSAMAMAQVVVFDDDSIHVAAPPLCGLGEEQMVAALKMGLETLGYDVSLTGNGGNVELTGVHGPTHDGLWGLERPAEG